MKSFAAYQLGSFFVYEDSSTNDYDSLYVVAMTVDTFYEEYGNYKGYHETVICKLKDDDGFSIFLTIPVSQNQEGNTAIRYERTQGLKSYNFFCMVGPIEIGRKLSGLSNETEIVGLLDEYILDGVVYNNVIVISLTNDNRLNSPISFLYYAPNIGLIQWRSSDNSRNYKIKNYKVFY